MHALENQIFIEQNCISPDSAKIEALRNEPNNHDTMKAKGARIRSKILNYEEGETSSKFSLGRKKLEEKANFGNK